MLHSRLTVPTETPNTCAVSSTLKPGEEAQFDDAAFARAQRLERVERLVERHEIDVRTRRHAGCFGQRHVELALAALGAIAGAPCRPAHAA